MATVIKIAEDTSEKLDKASEALGLKRQEIVDRALLVYLDNLEKYIELKEELKDWDSLSDEALVNFEKSL